MYEITFVLSVLLALLVNCQREPHGYLNLDPFKQAVRKAQVHIKLSPILTNSSTKHDCALPRDAVMYTYTNAKNVPLLELMIKSLEVNNMKSCLLPQIVVTCFDIPCVESCARLRIPLCPYINVEHIVNANEETGYKKGSYFFFTYVKHELMQAALSVVNHVLLVDVDMLILHNPWPEMFFPSNVSYRVTGGYELRYQRERGNEESCTGLVNTGVLFMRNTTKVRGLVAHMLTFRHDIVSLRKGHDQRYFNKIITSHQLSRCSLPPLLFASHCLYKTSKILDLDHTSYTASDVVTFHATCCRLIPKEQVLRKALANVQHAGNMSLIDFTASE
eukprot:gene28304-34176_t